MVNRLFIALLLLTFCISAWSAESGLRRRPGESRIEQKKAEQKEAEQPDPNKQSGLQRIGPPPVEIEPESVLIPDRWRLLDTLGITDLNWKDPYNRNKLKADTPVHGDWFLNLLGISDTVVEPRRIPTPVAPQGTARPDELNVIGDGEQYTFNQNIVLGVVYYKGNTTFRPPDYEYRATVVLNYNYTDTEQNRATLINPQEGTSRTDSHISVQELFFDKHLRNVNDRYDFDSLRIGIQPFTADFRGFLFIDEQPGIRLFGTRRNNRFQYNIVWFRRYEKDTNSGLNDVNTRLRDDQVFLANFYFQDFPKLGHTSQLVLAHNRNREGDRENHFNQNGFLVRPASLGLERSRNYDVSYVGYNGDGHLGRLNLSTSFYYAFGDQTRDVFVDAETDIKAFFAAGEASIDVDWTRLRFSLLYQSGDPDPFDDEANGYDAIFENPLFAGADTSFWIRQSVPLIGGGGVALSTRNGILNNLRSSKEEGQSNFTNPGLQLIGIGADFDLGPRWRLSANANYLQFDKTDVLEVARNQGSIDREIGFDVSLADIYRPKMTQNIVLRASAAALLPGQGYKQLYGDETGWSFLLNLVLTY